MKLKLIRIKMMKNKIYENKVNNILKTANKNDEK